MNNIRNNLRREGIEAGDLIEEEEELERTDLQPAGTEDAEENTDKSQKNANE